MDKAIVWFRLDLRLHDNPALFQAALDCDEVYPVFVWDPAAESPWAPGEATRVWLARSLTSLQVALRRIGLDLTVLKDDAAKGLSALCRQQGVRRVYFNERSEPNLEEQSAAVTAALSKAGVSCHPFQGHALQDFKQPVVTGSGGHFQVFTPFARKLLSELNPRPELPLPAPRRRTGQLNALTVDACGMASGLRWAERVAGHWQIGEDGARARLQSFLENGVVHYAAGRDVPAGDGTSRLSPYLHFGELSPCQVWHACMRGHTAQFYRKDSGPQVFIKELLWREFCLYILKFFPHGMTGPYRRDFEAFPWSLEEDAAYESWYRGRTGFPIVDAGMRELWQTGWMHNRVRMIAASFLIKHLGKSWLLGARWFWQTLVDADLANNIGGWQWSAGCGMDGAPYFRIFNPTLQGRKFDPDGAYIRRWLPELKNLSGRDAHEPRLLGKPMPGGYPMRPIVDHAARRLEILAGYKRFRAALKADAGT